MPVVIRFLATATFPDVIGKIDVSWRVEVVTGDELRR